MIKNAMQPAWLVTLFAFLWYILRGIWYDWL